MILLYKVLQEDKEKKEINYISNDEWYIKCDKCNDKLKDKR